LDHLSIRLVADRDERLDKFVARQLPTHSRTKLAKLAAEDKVLVDGSPQKPSFVVRSGMEVTLDEPDETAAHDLTPADIPLDIRYEDEHLLVVNKPRGLAVHPAVSLKEPSLVNALLSRSHGLSQAGGSFRPGIVHRLDKETTGLIIVAKTDSAHVSLAKQIERKSAMRRYVAVVAGELPHDRFTINAPLARNKSNRILMAPDADGKTAITHIKRLGAVQAGTVLAAALETGRTHQIRVHLQCTGHAVLGDRLYAPKHYQDVPLQLHAAFLQFEHPVSGEAIKVYGEPPSDFVGATLVNEGALDPF
jgi:23S rRNA pseudouridine1911/1915/1917 synthase